MTSFLDDPANRSFVRGVNAATVDILDEVRRRGWDTTGLRARVWVGGAGRGTVRIRSRARSSAGRTSRSSRCRSGSLSGRRSFPTICNSDQREARVEQIVAEEKKRKKPRTVAGFDYTFSVPKSVSTLWAVADGGVQALIGQAHHAAIGCLPKGPHLLLDHDTDASLFEDLSCGGLFQRLPSLDASVGHGPALSLGVLDPTNEENAPLVVQYDSARRQNYLHLSHPQTRGRVRRPRGAAKKSCSCLEEVSNAARILARVASSVAAAWVVTIWMARWVRVLNAGSL